VAIIAVFVGVAFSAATFALIPDPGSSPSIFDDFRWSSTSNGFWHTNAQGAVAHIDHSLLTLEGNSIELDRRLQTDPVETVVSTRVRALSFHKSGIGLGLWHAGTIGMEFDDDGVRCGRATDFGYKVDVIRGWTKPPTGKWFYLEMFVKNPYPDYRNIPKIDDRLLKRVSLRCSVYDSGGRLLGTTIASNPPPNTHYVGLDEAYLRTWDNHNKYQFDWFYAGPVSGNPLNAIIPAARHPGV